MRPHILGIDHVVVLVRDLDAAAATFARLGFALTPRGRHSIGTQNHCLMFERDYLELLAVVEPHPVTTAFAEFLVVAEGAGAIAFSSDDAAAAHASLQADGIAAQAPVDFSRPVALPGGSRDARFRIVQLANEATPGCRAFLCQHFTPEVVWRDEYRNHPLGVVGLAGVTIATDAPDDTARAWDRVLGTATAVASRERRLRAGSAEIVFEGSKARRIAPATPLARAVPYIAALRLRVRDRATAAGVLERAGFDARRLADGSLAIAAEQAHGVALVFD
jgi:catechol 2,3-dioxygenase-like lactoylglutathione lyase family enzyme